MKASRSCSRRSSCTVVSIALRSDGVVITNDGTPLLVTRGLGFGIWMPSGRLPTPDSDGPERARRALEHLVHHARGELAGIRVLAARVIAADERVSVGQ